MEDQENTEISLDNGGLLWRGLTPEDQGFDVVSFPLMYRKNSNMREYYVYSDKKNFVISEADTVVDAVAKSGIEKPVKVFHVHARIPARLDNDKLSLKTIE